MTALLESEPPVSVATRSVELGRRLDAHRDELGAHCRRTLGSAFEAEDAVQETLVRAWRAFDRFESRASVRTWLFRIATNVCLDMRKARQRRASPMDLASASVPDTGAGPACLGSGTRPVPEGDGRAGADPSDAAVARDEVRLAFVAALRDLPPRQRAVLILREVLRWPAVDVAELLGTTVPSVNSALQRARATLAARGRTADGQAGPTDATERSLLARSVDAFERYDVDLLVSLLL